MLNDIDGSAGDYETHREFGLTISCRVTGSTMVSPMFRANFWLHFLQRAHSINR